MKYVYDSEFIEDGKTIDLISIGIVAEDGRELYLINQQCEFGNASDWVRKNVLANLPLASDTRQLWRTQREIAFDVRQFITETSREDVELWADYCAYDHVVLCQLYGTMMDLPPNIPMFTNDIQQLWRAKGRPGLPKQDGTAHDALEDARHGITLLKFLEAL